MYSPLQSPSPRVPPEAKKVFEGVIFDIYQWQQKMYDGTFATFERARRMDAVYVIPVTEDGRIVTTVQEQPGKPKPFIALPGGHIDKGEEPLEAAKRELREETGYEAKHWDLRKVWHPSSLVEYAIYAFIARGAWEAGEMTPDCGEKISVRLVSFDAFADMASAPGFRHSDLTECFLRARLEAGGMEELRREIVGD